MNNQQLKTFCCYSIRSNVDGCMHVKHVDPSIDITKKKNQQQNVVFVQCEYMVIYEILNEQFEFKIQIYITNDTSQKKKNGI